MFEIDVPEPLGAEEPRFTASPESSSVPPQPRVYIESPVEFIHAAMRKLIPTRWHLLDWLHDAWTVISSAIDIITDVLVACSFYNKGHMTFFWLSILIFTAAQLSYAFLFTGTWASKHSTFGKLAVFMCVLPFGQLIPIFTWLESFRIPVIDQCLGSLSLTPTGKPKNTAEAAAETSEADSLWGYIQRKYTAHAGFLAEAFVEAIPQAVLQLVAVLVVDDTSVVNIFSILMSITVVASKGYLVAYSIHRPSFVFNYLTVAADCFNLFASATWLFVALRAEESDPFQRHPWFLLPLMLGLVSSAFGGFATLVFTIMDDHLKVLHPGVYEDSILEDNETVWFDIYLIRLVAWALAIVPVSVVYISAKFAVLPVAFFGSLDPEHAISAAFYRPIFQFLHGRIGRDVFFTPAPPARAISRTVENESNPQDEKRGCRHAINKACRAVIVATDGADGGEADDRRSGRQELRVSAVKRFDHMPTDRQRFGELDRQLRLEVANRFLKSARANQPALTSSLTHTEAALTEEHAARRARLKVESWLKGLNTVDSTRLKEDDAKAAAIAAAKLAEEEARLRAGGGAEAEAAMLALMREQAALVRRENLRRARDDAVADGGKHLRARSEILRHFLVDMKSAEAPTTASADPSPATTGCSGLCVQIAADAALFRDPSDKRWTSLRFRPSFKGVPRNVPGESERLSRRWLAMRRIALRVGGLIALANVSIAAAIWAPSTLLFFAYSMVFPLTQLPHCVAAWEDDNDDSERLLLPCVLTWSYLACLLGLLTLTPLVSRFQLMRADLRTAKGFPKAFYGKFVVQDIFQRYSAAMGRIEVNQFVRARVGRYNAMRVFSYLDEMNHGPSPYS